MTNADGATAAGSATDVARCLRCDYPLRGLGGVEKPRCPECGLAFNPRNPHTMSMGRPLGAFARWVLGPTGWGPHVLLAVLSLWTLWDARVPRRGPPILIAVTVVVWSLVQYRRRGLRQSVLSRYGRPERWRAADHRPWVDGAIVFVTAVLVSARMPARLAFAYSRPALDAMAAQVRGTPPGVVPPNRRVGLYQTTGIMVRDNGAIEVYFAGDGHLRWCPPEILARWQNPDSDPPEDRLGGDW